MRSFRSSLLLVGVVTAGASACEGPGSIRFQPERRPPPSHVAVPLDRGVAGELLRAHLRHGEALQEVVPWALPASDRSIAVGVAYSQGNARRFEVDELGTPVVLEDILAAEDLAIRAIRGKMTAALDERQRGLRDDDPIDFDIALAATLEYPQRPYNGDNLQVSRADFEADILARRARNRATLAALKAPLMAWLYENGAAVDDLENLPMISVHGTAALLRDARLEHADVASVGLPDTGPVTLLGHAGHASMRQSSFTGGMCGGPCNGGGLGVGIWEKGSNEGPFYAQIATNNLRLGAAAPDDYFTPPSTCTTDNACPPSNALEVYRCSTLLGKCVNEHKSLVAAMLGMQGSYTYPSAIPGLGGLSFPEPGASGLVRFVANDNSSVGLNWYLAKPSVHLNRSVDGGSGGTAFATNWAARYDTVLATVAAGNDGTETVANALFINAISVGGYRYETWNDLATHRRHTAYSSYLNNATVWPGNERPNILGPMSHFDGAAANSGLNIPVITAAGTNAMATTRVNGYQAIGTSFAAPAVLSVAIQAHQYAGLFSNLYYPVVRKAVVMAASRDSNADGSITKGSVWSSTPDGEDGAGHPDMALLKTLLDSNAYAYAVVDDSMFTSCGVNCRSYPLGTASVGFRGRLKVALVWNACTVSQNTPATESPTDFDLVITRPAFCGGTQIQSASINNEVEMIFDSCLPVNGAPRGTYQYALEIRIKNGGAISTGCGTSEPVGLAWSIQ